MKSPLHILHLEDDPNDAALVQSTLEAGDIACSVTQVQDRANFLAALERGDVDLVLADVSLPAFDGMSALQIVRDCKINGEGEENEQDFKLRELIKCTNAALGVCS